MKELELKLTSVQEELCSSRDAAAANEERLSAELSTVNKLVELYKESSEEWSQKAGELEGVIKALETHLSQVENDYKERLEKEISARKQLEKVCWRLLPRFLTWICFLDQLSRVSILFVWKCQLDALSLQIDPFFFNKSSWQLIPIIRFIFLLLLLCYLLLLSMLWSLFLCFLFFENFNTALD